MIMGCGTQLYGKQFTKLGFTAQRRKLNLKAKFESVSSYSGLSS